VFDYIGVVVIVELIISHGLSRIEKGIVEGLLGRRSQKLNRNLIF
jgi:hypothetical protein